MILYALACESGHRFETWFRDGAAYDEQVAHQAILCPTCGSKRVAKTVMAPAVTGTRKTVAAYDQPSDDKRMDVALLDDKSRELRALLKTVREKVIAEGLDVGARFPSEARRMHEGEIPARQIYGKASPSEARELVEDGILVLPLPNAPDELN